MEPQNFSQKVQNFGSRKSEDFLGNKKENIKLNEKKDGILVFVNTGIYPLDVIYSAAYVFLDKTYVLLDGDPKKEVVIELKFKDKKSNEEGLKNLGREFFNELLSYSFYKKQVEKNSVIRQAILQRALITNLEETDIKTENQVEEDTLEELEDIDNIEDYIEDPEGIAIPWEEKYGEKAKKDENKTK